MPKIAVIYWSGTGNTERMAALIAEGAREAGADVNCRYVGDFNAEEIVDYDLTALGSPAMAADRIEESRMRPFVDSIKESLSGRKIALFGSHGWSSGEWLQNWRSEMKGCLAEVVEEPLAVRESPDGENAAKCTAFGKRIARHL